MDTSFCKRIDEEMLVEQYVKDKLSPADRTQFELHLKDCQKHTQAVALEKALQRGISAYARSEIRTRLERSIRKKEAMRFYILRYAAILFVVVITPLMLYYQFGMPGPDAERDLKKSSEIILADETAKESKPAEVEQAPPGPKETESASAPTEERRAARKRPGPPLEQSPTPVQMQEETADILSAEPALEENLAPAPAITGTGIRGFKAKSSHRDAAGVATSLYKKEIDDALEREMQKCVELNRSQLTVEQIQVIYSYQIDTTGTASQITLIHINQPNNSLDSCFKAVIQNNQFTTPVQDSLITRSFDFYLK